ncbi:pyridoxal-phosphate-dependent aminotransferase family protein [Micromonospora parathelypteridis]|uniref:pyridoxal-phosphate-dependent aminotransferase family protein n=1 Tax=Micromonospora parathelypteridis TaxID=1839617 RepID=UPI0021A7BF01|nr:alanine--glyoxylate aminotransferase family protein [Micromonospora parathelypteridis]
MRLRVPGPTPVPPRVLRALGQQVIYHRSSEFKELLHDTAAMLQPLFGTTAANPIVLTSSGTGALEAVLANSLRPGDRVLTLDNGHWGARFGRLATSLGASVEALSSSWGGGADAEALRRRLSASDGGEFVAVLVAHNDTFTGAVTDLAAISDVVRDTSALLVVDAVSSLGCLPIEVDSWGLDLVVSASQKGLMCPPGLALVTASEKAWKRIDKVDPRGEYFDLRRARDMAAQGQATFTPAVNLVRALHEALRMVHETGLTQTFARQAHLGRALAAGVAELGMSLYPNADAASPCVSVLRAPEGVDAAKIVATMRDRYGTQIAGARRSRLDGTVIRIGTMGYCRPDDIRLDVWQLAGAVQEQGHTVDVATAIAATERELEEVAA